MAALKPSDVVLVTKLDRLGRSTRELLDLIDRIGKAGAVFHSLGDPLWDWLKRSPLNRPPQPALDRGRVQKRIRRAYVATGKLVLSTSELMRWTHPRAGGKRHNHRRAIRGAAERYCVRVGRVSGLGRPILWRLCNTADD